MHPPTRYVYLIYKYNLKKKTFNFLYVFSSKVCFKSVLKIISGQGTGGQIIPFYYCLHLQFFRPSTGTGQLFDPISLHLEDSTITVKFRYCERATKFEKSSYFENYLVTSNKVGYFSYSLWISQNV